MKLLNLISNTFKGQTIWRSLLNNELAKLNLSGEIIDLGSGTNPSYLKLINFREPYQLTLTDYYYSRKNLLKVDLEKKFKLKKENYNQILCINVLEHTYNFTNIFRESFRILHNRGNLIIGVPFVYGVHGSPNDYFRYTDQALKKLAQMAGFRKIKIKKIGYSAFIAAFCQYETVMPKWLRPPFLLLNIGLDNLLIKYSSYHRERYPLGFLLTCQKFS